MDDLEDEDEAASDEAEGDDDSDEGDDAEYGDGAKAPAAAAPGTASDEEEIAEPSEKDKASGTSSGTRTSRRHCARRARTPN
ncbi:hypothetical protein I551_5317 [Mycobacterium ulcerans str. Harvey]|uniref:Uncharacterized protein n=1 Tax=Mycobacterium ulcerans str. Harvey TaxID=1299332 RepID=A0ABP3AF94_MYCUL|nr:hypothetical protein I551_5317 [Mycobacterium ulcerans str. Harvey]